MSTRLVLIALVALGLCGCRKSQPASGGAQATATNVTEQAAATGGGETAPNPQPSAPESSVNAQVPANPISPVTPIAIKDGEQASAALPQLTQALRKYSFEHHKLPGSFEDVVGAGYVTGLPQPPAGKKYSINTKKVEVELVNR